MLNDEQNRSYLQKRKKYFQYLSMEIFNFLNEAKNKYREKRKIDDNETARKKFQIATIAVRKRREILD